MRDAINELKKETERSKIFMDKISNEIRLVEGLLQKKGIPISQYEIDDSNFLVFCKERLMFLNKKMDEPRPLIEMPIDIRIFCYKHLDKFLKKVVLEMKQRNDELEAKYESDNN